MNINLLNKDKISSRYLNTNNINENDQILLK